MPKLPYELIDKILIYLGSRDIARTLNRYYALNNIPLCIPIEFWIGQCRDDKWVKHNIPISRAYTRNTNTSSSAPPLLIL
jgi:hypothetical protein